MSDDFINAPFGNTDTRERFQSLADSFNLHKAGVHPFDPNRLDEHFAAASSGEQATICFLLNLWDSTTDWRAGKFDVFDALGTWDDDNRSAFLAWAANPWWP